MPYQVYLLTSLGAPRNHHSIYISTSPDNLGNSGFIYQVTGNNQTGMTYGHKPTTDPEESHEFISKTYLGTVSEEDYNNDRIRSVVESIPAPAKQFDGPKRIDASVPLRRCQEWTAEAIRALKDGGVLRTEG
jgi:hypothetical protein